MNYVSKFALGQRVDVVRGGFTLRDVPIVAVTFFTPDEDATILGSNNPSEHERGVKYRVHDTRSIAIYQTYEVWDWMLEPAGTTVS